MEPEAKRSTKILCTIFILLVVGCLIVTYYRYMIQKDFTVTEEAQ